MSYNKGDKDFGEAPKVHKIRITLTSRKPQALEKVCTELIERAKSKVSDRACPSLLTNASCSSSSSLHQDLRVKGPVRLLTKNLKINTRKTPNGEGSKTWDFYEMRIHKRLIE